MIAFARLKESRLVFRLGMLSLVLAGLAKWLLPRTGWLPPDTLDGVVGLFYGVAIGALLLSLARGRAAA
jgi:hypothetical protein